MRAVEPCHKNSNNYMSGVKYDQ